MLTIIRYGRVGKYSPRVNTRAIVSPVYETFLLLVLIIWWLTVLEEFLHSPELADDSLYHLWRQAHYDRRR